MKLVQPTDFEILEAFADGERNNAVNIVEIVDRDQGYINTRLPQLADYELIRPIGPADGSGLYEITSKGKKALNHREKYDTTDADFESFLGE